MEREGCYNEAETEREREHKKNGQRERASHTTQALAGITRRNKARDALSPTKHTGRPNNHHKGRQSYYSRIRPTNQGRIKQK
jgi:hypothetical protein